MLLSVLTVLAFIVPLIGVWAAAYVGSSMGFSTMILTFGILSAISINEYLPLFEDKFAGSALSIPAALLCIKLCAARFGVVHTLEVINCITRGMIIFCIAQSRWLIAAVYFPDTADYSPHEAMLIFRNAVLLTTILYVGGLFLLVCQKALVEYSIHFRYASLIIIDSVVIAPVTLWATYSMLNPLPQAEEWAGVVVGSYIARWAIIILAVTPIYLIHLHKERKHGFTS